MTEQQAQQVLSAHGAVYKGRRDNVDWYWSPTRQRWIGKQAAQGGGLELKELPAGKSCGC